jgi:hypothetical protein
LLAGKDTPTSWHHKSVSPYKTRKVTWRMHISSRLFMLTAAHCIRCHLSYKEHCVISRKFSLIAL